MTQTRAAMVKIRDEELVPAYLFRTEPQDNLNGFHKTKPYPSHAGVELLMKIMLDLTGVAQHRLNRLLGVPNHSNYVYDWRKARSRPSALYLSRMLVLLNCVFQAAPIREWREIDWETGEIELLEERWINGQNRHLHPPPKRNLRDFQGAAGDPLAPPFKGHEERPGPLPDSNSSFRAGAAG